MIVPRTSSYSSPGSKSFHRSSSHFNILIITWIEKPNWLDCTVLLYTNYQYLKLYKEGTSPVHNILFMTLVVYVGTYSTSCNDWTIVRTACPYIEPFGALWLCSLPTYQQVLVVDTDWLSIWSNFCTSTVSCLGTMIGNKKQNLC
jgi:hypothetical protein